jgi:hypothetical protein
MDRQRNLRGTITVTEPITRRLEDVAYWRKRAGWYDDDAVKSAYNSKVLSSSTNYNDDMYSSGSSSSSKFRMKDIFNTAAQIMGAFVVMGMLILFIRAMRTVPKSRKRGRESSRSRSRSRSKSKARSRSKSRSSRKLDEYQLMEEKSNRSSRSKSSSRSKKEKSGRSKKDTVLV